VQPPRTVRDSQPTTPVTSSTTPQSKKRKVQSNKSWNDYDLPKNFNPAKFQNLLNDPGDRPYNLIGSLVPMALCQKLLKEIKAAPFTWSQVFADGEHFDADRLQMEVVRSTKHLPIFSLIWDLVQKVLDTLYKGYRLHSPASILHSFADSEHQALHADFSDVDLAKYKAHLPLVIILSLTGSSTLDLGYEGSGVKISMPVPKGGGLIFPGNAIHRGRGYSHSNYRIHWYCHHKSLPLSKPGANTHLLEEDHPDYREKKRKKQ